MNRISVLLTLVTVLFFSIQADAQRNRRRSAPAEPPVQKIDTAQFKGMTWRNIGPFRGGRSVAVVGVPGDPMTYFMGGTGGGIWKTVDAGLNWKNISDGYLKTGSVGDLAISDSDPNVIYAGMGEHAVRGVMTSHGDGVYKSTDGGKTWKHMGLELTRHISDVVIHPNNPDIVFVAAQGAVHGPTQERGIYKSTDGGETWKRTLFVNETTGASGLSMDKSNPRIMYAALWDHIRHPWQVRSGGPGSGLHKSTDGGETWTPINNGLPKEMGKTAVSVSGANPDRVYANIEAKDGGVYRSEDGGKKWSKVTGDRTTITRAWYYTEIFADPVNADVVYVLNATAMRSIDGGRTFRPMPVGHGDTHDLWINPDNNNNIILGDDGGAEISFNAGKTWSTLQNQPTSQFYRVNADKMFPYNVYGGQQDNSSVIIASRGRGGGIEWKDWTYGPGCESAYLAFDPENPVLVYGGCYQGNIEVVDMRTKTSRDIMQYPYQGLGKVPSEMKYRFNWNAPIIASHFDPSVIYHAGNVVFKTTDGGSSWEKISDDLTNNNPEQQIKGGGPITNEGAGGENYNTLMYLTESTHKRGTLWAGSDDGRLHMTPDDGATWNEVTPPGMGEAMINSIEVSPHREATVFVVATKYKFNDYTPMVYKSDDFGATWKMITRGIDQYDFVRVVREDPKVEGLLYAGTETGLYISKDDGASWTKVQLNLPVVPINDLIIRDNDLVAATAGRGFWILDDLGPLQQSGGELGDKAVLFEPKGAVRINGYSSFGVPRNMGQNPKGGVVLNYYLPEALDTVEMTLEILNSNDEVIRSYSNQKDKSFKPFPGGPAPKAVLPTKKGINQFSWDFRLEGVPHVKGVFVFGDYRGHRVVPGDYKARMTVGEESSTVAIQVLKDPRKDFSDSDFDGQQEVLNEIRETVSDLHSSVDKVRNVRNQISKFADLFKDTEEADTLISFGKAILKDVKAWESELVQTQQKTFQDVINYPNQLNTELMDLSGRVDTDFPAVTAGAKERLADLKSEWLEYKQGLDDILEKLDDYNQLYKDLELPVVVSGFEEN